LARAAEKAQNPPFIGSRRYFGLGYRKRMEQALDARLEEAKAQRERYRRLVQRLEAYADRDPAGYALRVRLLAYLGYAFIFGMLLLAALVTAAMIFLMVSGRFNFAIVKLLLIAAPLVYVIARAAWIKIPPPDDLQLSRAQAPELYAEVDRITDKLRAPRVDAIHLDHELNAAAAQVPRFGLFGPYRNHLILGLPLLYALRADEARAVIGHELGHFSGNHGWFGGWIYRLHATWDRIFQMLAARQDASLWLFAKFFGWYSPLFDAYTFALRRANEYDADRAAVAVAGAEAVATGLMRLEVTGSTAEKKLFRDYYAQVRHLPKPPGTVYTGAGDRLALDQGPEEVAKRLEACLRVPTDYSDSHPSLRDRLHSVGFDAPPRQAAERLLAKGEPSAAEVLLGASYERVLAAVERDFHGRVAPWWEEEHQMLARCRERLQELDAAANCGESDEFGWAERCELTARVEGEAAAIEKLREGRARFPQSAGISYLLGQMLLEMDLEEGERHLEEAGRVRPELRADSLAAIASFRYRRGDVDAVATLREEALEVHVAEALVEEQWTDVKPTDRFAPHGLPNAAVEAALEVLQELETVSHAFLVRKFIPAQPASPRLVVIAIMRKRFSTDAAADRQQLAQVLTESLRLGESFFAFVPEDRKVWDRVFENAPDALIFDRRSVASAG
jgi:Zn-dependent protease with chaperone function